MTNDLSDFEQKLGQELKAAAYRRIEARNTKASIPLWLSASLATTAVIAVIALAAFVVADIRPQPASAHPFKIIRLANEIHLEIIDLVGDPRAAEEELKEELGIDIEFVAVPAPPELLNEVRGASSTGTTNTRVIFDDAGNSERIILPREIDGKLIIRYGREAHSGEDYGFHVTSPICRDLWAKTSQQTAALLAELANSVRYDTIDSSYNGRFDVALTDIDPSYVLIDALFLNSDDLLVVFSANLDALGANRPNCGWSAAQN